jgi:hypothetical protein
MALAKCVRPCFDNQATRYYDRGEVINIELDSLLAKTKCFQFIEEPKLKVEPESGIEPEPETKRGPGRPPKDK